MNTEIRARLETVPDGLTWLRDLRYLADTGLADWTDEELGQAYRWLTACRYSADQGARKIALLLAERPPQQEEEVTDGHVEHTADDGGRDAFPARNADAGVGCRGG